MSDYAKINLREVEDMAPKFGIAGVEARFPKSELGSSIGAVSLQRLAPNRRQPFGHRHAEQEEHYVVLEGSGRVRIGDDTVEVGAWDVVRIAAPVMRAVEAGPDGLEFLAFGAPVAEQQDVENVEGWWG